MPRAALLANVDRIAGDQPSPRREDDGGYAGHWHGSARDELERWRRRALAAEAELRAVRAEIAEAVRWRRGLDPA